MIAYESGRIGELIQANPGARSIVIDGNTVEPMYWVVTGDGAKRVDDAATVTALLTAITQGFASDDEVALTSTGLVTQTFAIDGVGVVVVRYARGPSASAVITIEPPSPPRLSDYGVPDQVVQWLGSLSGGLVLVGGERGTASELARSVYLEIAASKVDWAAAVIADRPLARGISRTPLLWIRRDARTGITRVGDAAAYAESFAKFVLLDIEGDVAGVVPSALRLADAGALVVVVAPGPTTSTVLERWRVGAATLGPEATWIATLSYLRLVITAETVTGRFGQENVCEWILTEDPAVTNSLAREGPAAIDRILSSELGGSSPRKRAIDALQASGRL